MGACQHGETDGGPRETDDRDHLGTDLATERTEEHDGDQADPAGDGNDIGHVGLLPAVHLVKETEQRVGGRIPERIEVEEDEAGNGDAPTLGAKIGQPGVEFLVFCHKNGSLDKAGGGERLDPPAGWRPGTYVPGPSGTHAWNAHP